MAKIDKIPEGSELIPIGRRGYSVWGYSVVYRGEITKESSIQIIAQRLNDHVYVTRSDSVPQGKPLRIFDRGKGALKNVDQCMRREALDFLLEKKFHDVPF